MAVENDGHSAHDDEPDVGPCKRCEHRLEQRHSLNGTRRSTGTGRLTVGSRRRGSVLAAMLSGMPTPILRATTESGAVWDDPSEDLLLELLGDIERGAELFVIVDRRGGVGDGQTYMQVILEGDVYGVERRDGSAERHFQATTSDKRLVHAVLWRWAFEQPGWQEALHWEPLALG